jgi:hypothetical protein
MRERDAVLRFGKKAEYVVDVLDFCGGEMWLEDLAQVVGGRARDLRSRILESLQSDRVLSIEDERACLREGWAERLYEVLELTGEQKIVERTRARYARQRAEHWTENPEEPESQQEDEEPDVICSVGEVFELAREFFGLTERARAGSWSAEMLQDKSA